MSIVDSLQAKIRQSLFAAAEQARAAGELAFRELPEFVVEVPREKDHGDFASNLALVLAREARKAPRQIAEIIVRFFAKEGTWVKKIEVAGPGFLNFHLDTGWLYQVLPHVEERDEDYGSCSIGQGQKVQVEFVSANPTGLLHMGNARGAALGDTIANLLEKVGYEVTREYYINDAGNQIENFARSLEARYLQQLGQDVPFPEDGYHGLDLIDTVKRIIASVGDKYLGIDGQLRREFLVKFALQEKLDHIRRVLKQFGVEYDVWFSEQSLYDTGAIEETIRLLEQNGYIYEKEGALWLKTSSLGLEKDEVLVRSNGIPTYYAADIAYHKNKFERGFSWVINLWGADHHAHVGRMKAALEALGLDPDRLDVVVMQLVRLFSGGELFACPKGPANMLLWRN
jgi:arginyl-tRNA synthetase